MDEEKFAQVLVEVAADLVMYAAALRMYGKKAEWDGSTYAMEAQAAVFDQLVRDNEIRSVRGDSG